MEAYRNYLKMLAQLQIDGRLQGKVDASDLVQETFLEAHRGFGNFHGTTEPELLKWLRRILASRLTALVRRFYEAERRNVRLERTLEADLDRSSFIARALACSQSSPSAKATRHEQAVVLANALERLPAHYREVILLRHFEELTFPEVARRMQRSTDSVKNLWVRALAALNGSLGEQSHGTS
jgi:RNA polymerase sigma-70 factor (ECF subfamily)